MISRPPHGPSSSSPLPTIKHVSVLSIFTSKQQSPRPRRQTPSTPTKPSISPRRNEYEDQVFHPLHLSPTVPRDALGVAIPAFAHPSLSLPAGDVRLSKSPSHSRAPSTSIYYSDERPPPLCYSPSTASTLSQTPSSTTSTRAARAAETSLLCEPLETTLFRCTDGHDFDNTPTRTGNTVRLTLDPPRLPPSPTRPRPHPRPGMQRFGRFRACQPTCLCDTPLFSHAPVSPPSPTTSAPAALLPTAPGARLEALSFEARLAVLEARFRAVEPHVAAIAPTSPLDPTSHPGNFPSHPATFTTTTIDGSTPAETPTPTEACRRRRRNRSVTIIGSPALRMHAPITDNVPISTSLDDDNDDEAPLTPSSSASVCSRTLRSPFRGHHSGDGSRSSSAGWSRDAEAAAAPATTRSGLGASDDDEDDDSNALAGVARALDVLRSEMAARAADTHVEAAGQEQRSSFSEDDEEDEEDEADGEDEDEFESEDEVEARRAWEVRMPVSWKGRGVALALA